MQWSLSDRTPTDFWRKVHVQKGLISSNFDVDKNSKLASFIFLNLIALQNDTVSEESDLCKIDRNTTKVPSRKTWST